jgi:hypothetical protein
MSDDNYKENFNLEQSMKEVEESMARIKKPGIR